MTIDDRLIFLRGRFVALKVLDEGDIQSSNWVGWFNDEERCLESSHHYWPNSFKLQENYLMKSSNDSGIHLGIVNLSDSLNICGVISLSQIDLIHRRAEIGITLDAKVSSKPEIFCESFILILKHGFNELGLSKIYGGSLREETPLVLNKLFNFEIEGILKNHNYKNGKFLDVTRFAVFSNTVKYPNI